MIELDFVAAESYYDIELLGYFTYTGTDALTELPFSMYLQQIDFPYDVISDISTSSAPLRNYDNWSEAEKNGT